MNENVLKQAKKGDAVAMRLVANALSKEAKNLLRGNVGEEESIHSLIHGESSEGDKIINVQAFEWYKKAADAGDIESMIEVGRRLYDGIGTEKNDKIALSYYLKAAELGNVRAMKIVAHMYAYNLGIDKSENNSQISLDWYIKAANTGDIDSIQNIIEMFALGKGVEQNFDKMNEWLGKLDKYDSSQIIFEIARQIKNPQQSFEFFQRAADAGHVLALIEIGEMYCNGNEVVEQDYEKAMEIFKKAAEIDSPMSNKKSVRAYRRGIAFAMCRIAEMYYCGDGVEQDYKVAFKWYQKAARYQPLALLQIGLMYYKGRGVAQDFSEAFECFKKAFDPRINLFGGVPNREMALYYLTKMYERGEGTQQNYTEIFKMHERLSIPNCKETKVMQQRADIYYLGKGTNVNYGRALMFYEKAAKESYWAVRKVISMYELGEGIEQNIEKANEWRAILGIPNKV